MRSTDIYTSDKASQPIADVRAMESSLGAKPAVQLALAPVVRQPTPADRDPARFRKRRRRLELTLAWCVPLVLLGLWQLTAQTSLLDPRFFPAPSRIWTAGVALVQSGELQSDFAISFERVIIGFLIGCIAGLLIGVPLGMFSTARAALGPTVYALWTVPKIALLPLLLLIFGLGNMPIIVLIAINCLFLVLIPTTAAIATVPVESSEVASSFGATRWELLRHVLFPAALPQMFVGLRLAAGASVLVMVAAEFVQSNTGLGYLIWHSWSLFLADRMYVGIVVVAVSGALFTMLIAALGNLLTPWSNRKGSASGL